MFLMLVDILKMKRSGQPIYPFAYSLSCFIDRRSREARMLMRQSMSVISSLFRVYESNENGTRTVYTPRNKGKWGKKKKKKNTIRYDMIRKSFSFILFSFECKRFRSCLEQWTKIQLKRNEMKHFARSIFKHDKAGAPIELPCRCASNNP